MGSKIITLLMGFALIATSIISSDSKPININFQIMQCSIGIVLCCAAFSYFIIDEIKKLKR